MKNSLNLLKSMKLQKDRPPIRIPALEQRTDQPQNAGQFSLKNKTPYATETRTQGDARSSMIWGSNAAGAGNLGGASIGAQGGRAYVDGEVINQKPHSPEHFHNVSNHEAQHQVFDQSIEAGNFKTRAKTQTGMHAQLASALIDKADLNPREMALLYHHTATLGYHPIKDPDEMVSNLVGSMNGGYAKRFERFKNANAGDFKLPSHENFFTYSAGLKQIYNKIKGAAESYKEGDQVKGVNPKKLAEKYGISRPYDIKHSWHNHLSSYEPEKYSWKINSQNHRPAVQTLENMRSASEKKKTAGGFDGYRGVDEKVRQKQ